jgi:hypothetical protein
MSLAIESFTVMLAIMKVTTVDDMGFDKHPRPVTGKEMIGKIYNATHRAVPVLYHRCHLQDKIM